MENSNIWIAVVVLGVMVVFFLIAYYTISKPKTNTIVVKAPQSYYTPAVPNIQPSYVIDASYHAIEPAPQVSGSIPVGGQGPVPARAPTTPLAASFSTPLVASFSTPVENKVFDIPSGIAKGTTLVASFTTPVENKVFDIPSGTKINSDVAALLLQKQLK
jgi:hypothetical protein